MGKEAAGLGGSWCKFQARLVFCGCDLVTVIVDRALKVRGPFSIGASGGFGR